MFVAVGSGTGYNESSIAYSYDGINWSAVQPNQFTNDGGRDVAWNGIRWVAVGSTPNPIAYSDDGINWTGVTGTNIFDSYGYSITWNGNQWIALGSGNPYNIAYSYDGIIWTGRSNNTFNKSPFYLPRGGIAWTAGLGSVDISGNSITLDQYGPGLTSTLDIVGSPYYNTGFTNLSISITPSA